MNKLFSNILVLFIVIIITLAGFEVLLRVTYSTYANFNTEMWRYSKEIKTLSTTEGVSHEHLPNKESFLYGVEIKTNSLGFRDQETQFKKPKNTKRILLIGDSVTLGWGVNQSDIYSEVLESMLNQKSATSGSATRYEVLNAAVGNYNTEMEVKMLRRYLFLEPDAIVIGFFPNDGEKTKIIKPGLSYELKKRLYLYPFFWDKLTKIKFALSKQQISQIHQYYTEEYGGRERIEKSFQELKQISTEQKIPVYIVIIPSFYNEFDNYDLGYVHQFIEDQCLQNGFTCIDTLEKFKNYKLPEVIVSAEDAHPNTRGHHLIAEKTFEVMKNDI